MEFLDIPREDAARWTAFPQPSSEIMAEPLPWRTDLLRCTALVLLFSLTGCFTYVPAPIAPLERGQRVRVHLSSSEEFRLRDVTVSNVVAIKGEAVSLDPDVLALSAWELRSGTGFEHVASGETVRIQRDGIAAIERYELSTMRSALLTGGVILAGVLLGLTVSGMSSGGEGPVGAPPTK
jgi:hypothetical protein